jgi:RNA polymerase sigma-70 factor (ECF subfamily)
VTASARHNDPMVRESEIALVRRALAGDGDAFSTLFQTHRGRVYAVCLRMTNNPADADDLTQEAFIQAFRKLSTFRGESALSTWLHRVAVNTALMHFRRRPPVDTSLEQICSGPVRREYGRQDERLTQSLERISLSRALEALPSGYRTIFELHEIGGYGHREIAKLLSCSIGNSKSQLHKAKQRIRECLVSRRHLARHLCRTARSEGAHKENKGVNLGQRQPDSAIAEAGSPLCFQSSTQHMAQPAA